MTQTCTRTSTYTYPHALTPAHTHYCTLNMGATTSCTHHTTPVPHPTTLYLSRQAPRRAFIPHHNKYQRANCCNKSSCPRHRYLQQIILSTAPIVATNHVLSRTTRTKTQIAATNRLVHGTDGCNNSSCPQHKLLQHIIHSTAKHAQTHAQLQQSIFPTPHTASTNHPFHATTSTKAQIAATSHLVHSTNCCNT